MRPTTKWLPTRSNASEVVASMTDSFADFVVTKRPGALPGTQAAAGINHSNGALNL